MSFCDLTWAQGVVYDHGGQGNHIGGHLGAQGNSGGGLKVPDLFLLIFLFVIFLSSKKAAAKLFSSSLKAAACSSRKTTSCS